jgi:hypothetical protein
MSTTLKPTARRPEFDQICDGWGSDTIEDLEARCQLLSEFWAKWGGLTSAEQKVADAMLRRLRSLGNNHFTFNVTAKEENAQ